jgi:cytochrome c oxidase subunit 3
MMPTSSSSNLPAGVTLRRAITTGVVNAGVDDPPELDVSRLPPNGFDWHAPLWWANVLTLFIETATIGLLLATYFYLMRNEQIWPPPLTDRVPAVAHPVPGLAAGTLNTVLLLLSCGLMYETDQWARRLDEPKVRRGLTALCAITVLSIVLRCYEFPAFYFKWNDNAYGSTVWTILGMHLIYLLVGLGEFGLMAAWVYRHGLDEKHALDVTLAGGYWYWVAAAWVLVYAVLYWVPRWV